MVTHSSILAWRIPWTEEPDYSAQSLKESATTYWLNNNKWLWGNPNHPLTSRFIGLCPLSPYSLLFWTFFSNNFMLAGWTHRPLLHLIFFTPNVMSSPICWSGHGEAQFQLSWCSFGFLVLENIILPFNSSHWRLLDCSRQDHPGILGRRRGGLSVSEHFSFLIS